MQKIETLSWGEIIVNTDNKIKTFKDVMVWPGGCCEWDWKKDGTRHSPGYYIRSGKKII